MQVELNFFIRKQYYAVPHLFYINSPYHIVLLLFDNIVVPSINFYNKFLFYTDDVCNIVSYWMLFSELVSCLLVS